MALPTEWTGLRVTGNSGLVAGVNAGERIVFRASRIGIDGQLGRYQYTTVCADDAVAPPDPPKDFVPIGFGGQIGIVSTPPDDVSFDRILVYVSENIDDLDERNFIANQIQPVGETSTGSWTSGIEYNDNVVYYARLRSIDISGNLSVPTPIRSLMAGALSPLDYPIQINTDPADAPHQLPQGALWIISYPFTNPAGGIEYRGEIHRRALPSGRIETGAWVFTGIDLLVGGGRAVHPLGERSATWEPTLGNNPPVVTVNNQQVTNIHDYDALVAADGRVWRFLESTQTFRLQGDLTQSLSVPSDVVDIITDQDCQAIYHSPNTPDWKPIDSDKPQGKGRHGDAAFNLLGQWWRNVYEAWVRQRPDLWVPGQGVVVSRFGSWPIQWDGIENIVPPAPGESEYGSPWHVAIMEDDSRRGECYRRDKRIKSWGSPFRDLCGDLAIPLAPLAPSVLARKTTPDPDDPTDIVGADFWDLSVTWFPQQVRLQPDHVEWFLQDLLADTERDPNNMDLAYRAKLWRGTQSTSTGEYEITTPSGGRRLAESLYRLWMRNKYDAYGNSPWVFTDFPIGESRQAIPTAPVPLAPTLLLQNSSGVTQTDDIADFSFAELGWQYVASKNDMGTQPNQLEIEMRGRVNTFRTRVWTNDATTDLTVTSRQVSPAIQGAGIFQGRARTRGGQPQGFSEYVIRFACGQQWDPDTAPSSWGSRRDLNVRQLRETTSSGLDPSIRTFSWQMCEKVRAAGSGLRHKIFEYIQVYGFDDTGGIHRHNLRNRLACDQFADFLDPDATNPSIHQITTEGRPSGGFFAPAGFFVREVPQSVQPGQTRSLTIRQVPGGFYGIVVYYSFLENLTGFTGELSRTERINSRPSGVEFAFCFPSLSDITTFGPPRNFQGIQLSETNIVWEFQFEAPATGTPNQYELRILNSAGNTIEPSPVPTGQLGSIQSSSDFTYRSGNLSAYVGQTLRLQGRSKQTVGIIRDSRWATYNFQPWNAANPPPGGIVNVARILPPSRCVITAGATRTSKIATLTQPAIGPQATSFPWMVRDGGALVPPAAGKGPYAGESTSLTFNLNDLENDTDRVKRYTVDVFSKATIDGTVRQSVDRHICNVDIDPNPARILLQPVIDQYWSGNDGADFPGRGDTSWHNFRLRHGSGDGELPDKFDWSILVGTSVVNSGEIINAPTTRTGFVDVSVRIQSRIGTAHIFRVKGTKPSRTDTDYSTLRFTPGRRPPNQPFSPGCSVLESEDDRNMWVLTLTAPRSGPVPEMYGIRLSGANRASRITIPASQLRYDMNVPNAGATTVHVDSVANSITSRPPETCDFTVRGDDDPDPPSRCLPPTVTGGVSPIRFDSWTFSFRRNSQGDEPYKFQWRADGVNSQSSWADVVGSSLSRSAQEPGLTTLYGRSVCRNDEGVDVFSNASDPFRYTVTGLLQPPTDIGITAGGIVGVDDYNDIQIVASWPESGPRPDRLQWTLWNGALQVASGSITYPTDISISRRDLEDSDAYRIAMYCEKATYDNSSTASRSFAVQPSTTETPAPEAPTITVQVSDDSKSANYEINYTGSVTVEYWKVRIEGPTTHSPQQQPGTSGSFGGLSVNAEYTILAQGCYVHATQGEICGDEGSEKFETTLEVPGPVSGLNAEVTTSTVGDETTGTISVTWNAPTTGGPHDSYSIVHVEPGEQQADADIIEDITSENYTITDVVPGAHTIYVIAVNEAGEGESANVRVEVEGGGSPNPVKNLTFKYSRDGTFLAEWVAPDADLTHEAATKYLVRPTINYQFFTSGSGFSAHQARTVTTTSWRESRGSASYGDPLESSYVEVYAENDNGFADPVRAMLEIERGTYPPPDGVTGEAFGNIIAFEIDQVDPDKGEPDYYETYIGGGRSAAEIGTVRTSHDSGQDVVSGYVTIPVGGVYNGSTRAVYGDTKSTPVGWTAHQPEEITTQNERGPSHTNPGADRLTYRVGRRTNIQCRLVCTTISFPGGTPQSNCVYRCSPAP